MVLFSPNRQPRIPLPVWRWPREDVLREERYKGDQPPFGFFPTVSALINIGLCPVAGVHQLFYGIDNAFLEPYVELGAGTIFDEFISHFKNSLMKETCACTLGGAKSLYDEYTRGENPNLRVSCWRSYVSPWLNERLRELDEINKSTRIYFQVHAMSDSIKIEGGRCKYPLLGKIDELDVSNKRIVERTILPSKEGGPPALKDFQVWLYWKLLCSVAKGDRPDIWRDENFENYKLFVETPTHRFKIRKEEFPKWAHDAFAWLNDFSSRRASYAIMEAYEEAERFCAKDKGWDGCVLYHRYCYRKAGRFPLARKAMHANVRKFYINLLYEQMWTHHLFLYQLLGLPIDDLSGWKILQGKIERFDGDDLIVSLSCSPESLFEKEEEEDIYNFDVILGTLRMGLSRKVASRGFEGNKLRLHMRRESSLPTEINIILPGVSIYRESPYFLHRIKQRHMRSFDLRGITKEDTAKRDSLIQFVEAAFGGKRLIANVQKKEGKR